VKNQKKACFMTGNTLEYFLLKLEITSNHNNVQRSVFKDQVSYDLEIISNHNQFFNCLLLQQYFYEPILKHYLPHQSTKLQQLKSPDICSVLYLY